jgi:ATP-dependent Clp protease ATP-binding subunit ClpC
MGFVTEEDAKKDYKDMKNIIMEEVKRSFNPEFINRIDGIIVFHPLTIDEMKQILDLLLPKVTARLSDQGIELIISAKAKDHLVEIGFDPKYGARPLQRVLQRSIEDPIAEAILSKKYPGAVAKDKAAAPKKGDKHKIKMHVDFSSEDKKLVFSNTPAKEKVRKED